MANAVALNMKFIAETSSLTTGAKQTAKMLTQLGNDVVRISQSFKQFAGDNVAASKAQQDLTTDANLLASQLQNGLISADQFREGMEELTSAARKQSDAFAEGISLTSSLATEEEKHAATANRLNQLLDAGAISQETFNRAMEKAESGLSANVNAEKQRAAVLAEGKSLTATLATEEEQHAATVERLSSLLNAGAISQETFNRAIEKAESSLTANVNAEKQRAAVLAEGKSLTATLATEEEQHAATVEKLSGLLDAGAISQETFNRAIEKAESSLTANVNAAKEHADVMSRGEKIAQSVATQEEKYAAEVKDLENLLAKGAISQETFNRAVDKAGSEMKGSEKEADRLSDQIKKMSSNLRTLVAIEFGKILAKGFSVAARAIGDVARNVAASAGELTKLAAISNTSVETFQGMATAAATVGIEHDKLADIFKDVGDRVGDFIQTGGGPMADFFQNIAPKVGVTAEQFARLSGPEALQLYVDSLQKAGLSQAEMTFYLEAMSSDLTAMLPLLRDGGAGMNDLADRAERLGITLSATQIDAIKEMNASLSLVYDTFESIIGQVTSNLAPIVTAISEEFLAFVEAFNGVGGQGATGIAEVLTQGLLDFADMLAGLFDMLLSGLGETFSDFDASASAFAGFISILEAFGRTIQTVFLSFQNVGLAIGGFLAGIAEFFGVEGAREYGAEVAKLQEQTRLQAEAAAFGIGEAGARVVGGGAGEIGPLQQFLRDMAAERETARQEAAMAAAAAAAAAVVPAAGGVPAGMTAAEQEYATKLEKLQKDLAESTRKAEEERQKKLTSLNESYAEESAKIEEQRLDKLAAVNQKALEASDIRSGGIGQVLALATGREDPAVEAARKQTQSLENIEREIKKLGGTVEIMGAA